MQDIHGAMGKVIGAEEFEATRKKLSAASDLFDVSSLLLQICLVLGAVGLVLSTPHLKASFYSLMWMIGSAGSVVCMFAYMRAFSL